MAATLIAWMALVVLVQYASKLDNLQHYKNLTSTVGEPAFPRYLTIVFFFFFGGGGAIYHKSVGEETLLKLVLKSPKGSVQLRAITITITISFKGVGFIRNFNGVEQPCSQKKN